MTEDEARALVRKKFGATIGRLDNERKKSRDQRLREEGFSSHDIGSSASDPDGPRKDREAFHLVQAIREKHSDSPVRAVEEARKVPVATLRRALRHAESDGLPAATSVRTMVKQHPEGGEGALHVSPGEHPESAQRQKPASAVQTGARGGKYIVLKSGQKFYVTSSGGKPSVRPA